MDTDRFLKISDIFHEAEGLSEEALDNYLQEACGDDTELRREIERLILEQQHFSKQEKNSFPDMERKSVFEKDPFSVADPGELGSGDQLGPYRVIRRLGEGGMGQVYLAERISDYQQQVAIKVARPGHLASDGIARFRSEMKFMADFSRHPQIAGILDAGTTDDGRPYLVMEFVDGDQVDRYCNTQRLSIHDRLRLFQSICLAIEFAHQHAVIHRDLKPGNILVTSEGEVKLIDFGIAKILSQNETQAEMAATQTGFRVLTPHYASPEQIRGEVLTISSDVYSMGVVLYELLTGRRPHDLKTTSVVEIERIVREEEPRQPSALAKGLAPELLRDRQLNAEQLRRTLSGDLDNIVMKCLRKEPNQRFQSVRELSDDIERHLSGHPISARPITVFQRTRLWCVRNPAVAFLSVALSLSLVGGLFGVTTQWRRAETNAADALAAADLARLAADQARAAASREKSAAEAERQERLKAQQAESLAAAAAAEAMQQAEAAKQVTDFMVGVFQGADRLGVRGYRFGPPPDGSANPTARELLHRGTKMIETELSEKPRIRASIKGAIAETYITLGDLDEAERLATEALETRRKLHGKSANEETAHVLMVLAMVRYVQGNYEASVPLYRESVQMLDEVYGEMDPRGAANKLFFAFVVLESNITGAENAEAERLINQVLEIRRAEAAPPPHELAHALIGKAIVSRVRGRNAEAIKALAEAQQVIRGNPAGPTYVRMALTAVYATVNWQLGRADAAMQQTQQVIETMKSTLGRYHPIVTHLQLDMSTRMMSTNPERGEAMMKDAIEACRVAYDRQPRTARAIYRYAGLLVNRGELLRAEELLQESVDIYLETLGRENVRTQRALKLQTQVLRRLSDEEKEIVENGE